MVVIPLRETFAGLGVKICKTAVSERTSAVFSWVQPQACHCIKDVLESVRQTA
jgi:hypothetical protein